MINLVLEDINYSQDNGTEAIKKLDRNQRAMANEIGTTGIEAHNVNNTSHQDIRQQINDLKSAAVLFNGTVSTGDIVLSYPVTNYNELVIGTGSSTTLLTIRVTHLAFPANFTVGTNFTVPTSNGVASLTVKDANTITINSTQLAIRRILGKKV